MGSTRLVVENQKFDFAALVRGVLSELKYDFSLLSQRAPLNILLLLVIFIAVIGLCA